MRLVRSPLPKKKWRAEFKDGTHTDFGDPMYQDYTQHHDPDRRAKYKTRHAKDLDTDDPRKAGFLSYYILWGNSTSVAKNLAAYKHRFGDL